MDETLKLWRISQSSNDGYDTYDSAIVCASDEDAARNITPDREWGAPYPAWCETPEQVKVELIGTAAPVLAAGVILASFNAG